MTPESRTSSQAKRWGTSLAVVLVIAAMAFVVSAADRDGPSGARAKVMSGGDGTVFNQSHNAFGLPLTTLPVARLRDFTFGNRMFNTNWVTAPASVASLDGLGPLFNRVSCSACHLRDGRGEPPSGPDEPMLSMLVRLSMPGQAPDGGPKPHPVYGGQLNDRAIQGVKPEGRVSVSYSEQTHHFPDGEVYHLRTPHYTFKDMNYGALPEEILYSPRVAPAVYGLGLLEAIDEQTILKLADPDDADGDGISGRPNHVWDQIQGKKALGRFGWKANAPSLRQQNAGAALGDIGITTSLNPKQNVGEGQMEAASAPEGGAPEMSDEFLDKLTFYTQVLAVPARRDVEDPDVRRGEALFSQIGCAACHTPHLKTGEHPRVAQLSHQTISPYTDLLLHDMGEALADGRPDYEANGREWRTPPLWGMGLVKVVNGHDTLSHDGRARGPLEAIMWHGGEAEASRKAFAELSKKDRAALIRFLNSL